MSIRRLKLLAFFGIIVLFFSVNARADECSYVSHEYIQCPTGSACVSCPAGSPQCRRLSYAEKITSGSPCLLCSGLACDVAPYSTDSNPESSKAKASERSGGADRALNVLEQFDDADLSELRELFSKSPVQFETVILLLEAFTRDGAPVALQIVGFNPWVEKRSEVKAFPGRGPSSEDVERMRSWFQTKNTPANGRVNEYVEAELLPTQDGRLRLVIRSWPTSFIEQDGRATPPRLRSVVIAESVSSGSGQGFIVHEAASVSGN